MLQVRKASDRGQFDHGWLKTAHTFSFGEYYDNRFLGFRDLRVINEDRIQEGVGFPTHPHRDMEIITYVLDGELAHKDSMGNGSVIRAGDVQYMSAGSGVTHSEFNPSPTTPTHLLQIWILPKIRGAVPRYGQKQFAKQTRLNQLRLVASSDGRDESIEIRQDASLYASILEAGKTLELPLAAKRHAWIQVARGSLTINGQILNAGDGVAITDENLLVMKAASLDAEFLVFDLT